MSPRTSVSLLVGAVAALAGPPVAAQEVWQGPQEPCALEFGHSTVESAAGHLKAAVEAEVESDRERHFQQAYDALTRAFQGFDQENNSAAWYYLGRYYVYRSDGAGADSSFRRAVQLAPQCEPDIEQYRAQLGSEIFTKGLEAWAGGATDSALAHLTIAHSLQPEDANVPYYMARIVAERGQLDSALRYLRIGDSVAGDDPAFQRQRRNALLEVARRYEELGMEAPGVQRLAPARLQRDSLRRAIARDSALLAQLIAEWAGQRLRPEVQQRVQRDSITLARRLEAARQAMPAVSDAIARDSAEVWQHLRPALEAYDRYLEAFPDDARTLLKTLEIAATAGATASIDSTLERLTRIEQLNLDELSLTAVAVFNSGQYGAAARLLEIGLEQNPYHRTALFLLTRAYYTLGDRERCMPTAQRLMEVDPLNPQSAQMMAFAWNLAGQSDSAQHYLQLFQGGLGWSVNVAQFIPAQNTSVLNGAVTNIGDRPLEPIRLVFDFLAADGTVVGSATVDVPALQPGARHALSVRTQQGGAVAWRYRKQQ